MKKVNGDRWCQHFRYCNIKPLRRNFITQTHFTALTSVKLIKHIIYNDLLFTTNQQNGPLQMGRKRDRMRSGPPGQFYSVVFSFFHQSFVPVTSSGVKRLRSITFLFHLYSTDFLVQKKKNYFYLFFQPIGPARLV